MLYFLFDFSKYQMIWGVALFLGYTHDSILDLYSVINTGGLWGASGIPRNWTWLYTNQAPVAWLWPANDFLITLLNIFTSLFIINCFFSQIKSCLWLSFSHAMYNSLHLHNNYLIYHLSYVYYSKHSYYWVKRFDILD